MGVYDDYIVENLKGLDALLLEANHDVNMLQVGKYPYYLKRRILGDEKVICPMRRQDSCFVSCFMII